MPHNKNKVSRKGRPVHRIPTLSEVVIIRPGTSEPRTLDEQTQALHEEPEELPEEDAACWPDEQTLAELRSSLTTQTIDLASQLLHGAVREMEAALLEQVLDRLRQQLPALIDDVLNEQLALSDDPPENPC
ncbi:MAG: hypothetical protein MUP90_07820 [Gammaproteobacteria bacterium]|nr:hypothetical protein [Gammaproteobacteria bacterium]